MDPVVFVVDNKSKEIVSQIFGFVDILGGKALINADQIEKFLAVRGILEPKGTDIEAIMHGKKESEVHELHTKMAKCSGPNFALNLEEFTN